MIHSAHKEKKLQWKWVVLSVVAGLIIVGAAYFIVAPMFHSGEVQVLMMLGGCIITGVVIGYFSPGITMNEASIGGALVMLIMFLLRAMTNAEIHFSPSMTILLCFLGVGFRGSADGQVKNCREMKLLLRRNKQRNLFGNGYSSVQL
jgi:asparagine N-glycosylation enzyme membrane subunit Stt3